MIWDFYGGLKLKNPMIRTRDTAFFLIWKRREFQNKGSVKSLEEKLMKNWKSWCLHKPFWEKATFKGSFFLKRFMKIYTFPIFHQFFPLNFCWSLWLAGFEFKFPPSTNHKLHQKFGGKDWWKIGKVHLHEPFREKATFNRTRKIKKSPYESRKNLRNKADKLRNDHWKNQQNWKLNIYI